MLTQPAKLTEQERAWLEQTRWLISVMSPLPSPPKNLLQGVIPYPSTSMPLNLEAPSPPYMLTPSTESHLPTPNNLIRQILRMDQFPTPNFTSQYPRVTKHPSVATLMVPPSEPVKLAVVIESPVTSSRQISHLDSYETTGSTSSHSPSPTMTESLNTLTISTLL